MSYHLEISGNQDKLNELRYWLGRQFGVGSFQFNDVFHEVLLINFIHGSDVDKIKCYVDGYCRGSGLCKR